MAEIKRTFSAGSMEKDIDERLVPNGKYTEALNISVATSEDSDVGAAQNILGNIQVTQAIQSRSYIGGVPQNEYDGENYHITQVVDPQNDMLYRFVHTASPTQGIWMDRIIEFNTRAKFDEPWQSKENAVMVDIFKVQSVLSRIYTDHDRSNKSQIKVTKNLNQLRWGMRVDINGLNEDATIDHIDYLSGVITINKRITSSVGQSVIFYGDRNLSFGSVDVTTGDVTGLRNITAVNIIDGMIFWTDNHSEPKKINIKRSKDGCDSVKWAALGLNRGNQKIDDFNQHTFLVINEEVPFEMVYDDSISEIYVGNPPNNWVTGGGGITPPPVGPAGGEDLGTGLSSGSPSTNFGGAGNYGGYGGL